MSTIVYVTGTDTGVGKTVLSVVLTRVLQARAFKPLCSGGRADARQLRAAQKGGPPLDFINPWHFADPVTPLLAARREGRQVTREAVVRHVREGVVGARWVLVEGAGGLLSPLLPGADAPELIHDLEAIPVVVAVNRLGVIHQVRAVCGLLAPEARARAVVVLMDPRCPDDSTADNPALLRELLGELPVLGFPRLSAAAARGLARGPMAPGVRRAASRIARAIRAREDRAAEKEG
ncbi:MAG: dethiobiotin synthase [Verrucomicrobiota bacterium]